MPGNLLEEEELHKNVRDGCWRWASTRVGAGERELRSPTLTAEVFVTGRFRMRESFSQSPPSAWCSLVTPPGFCVSSHPVLTQMVLPKLKRATEQTPKLWVWERKWQRGRGLKGMKEGSSQRKELWDSTWRVHLGSLTVGWCVSHTQESEGWRDQL